MTRPVIVRARVARLTTADGLCEFQDHVPIGKEYLIDLASRTLQPMLNTRRGVEHKKEIVREYQLDGVGAWLPLECLELFM